MNAGNSNVPINVPIVGSSSLWSLQGVYLICILVKRGILWLASLNHIHYFTIPSRAGEPMYGTDGENRGKIGVNMWRIGVCHLPIDH